MIQSDFAVPRPATAVLVKNSRGDWHMVPLPDLRARTYVRRRAVCSGPALFLQWRHTGDPMSSGPVLLDSAGGVGCVWSMDESLQSILYAPLTHKR